MGERSGVGLSVWSPPTATPEAGQGPWCDPNFNSWWCVAPSPADALAFIQGVDADVFPIYFGWHAEVKRVHIRWVKPEDWDEETEIEECAYSTDEGAVEAWRVRVVGA